MDEAWISSAAEESSPPQFRSESALHESADSLPEDFVALCTLVHRASGIKIDGNKRALVDARLRHRLVELGLPNLGTYLEFVGGDASGRELEILLDLISTNVTSFFRERHHFEHLAREVLANHLKPGLTGPLRIWSAACSSGEEPYSIALSLANALGPTQLNRFLILASDLSSRMVDRAAAGIFPSEALSPVPAHWRATWFKAVGTEDRQVVPRLRERVRARRLNLLAPWPMQRSFSAIFCRNALIYFDEPTRQRLVERFWDQLAPGGYLYIGHSESLSMLNHRFEYAGPTIYRRPQGASA